MNQNRIPFLNSRISDLNAYEVPEVYEGEIKLDAQENPYPIPAEIQEKISRSINSVKLNRYPDAQYPGLKKVIGEYCGINANEILVGNGSDELIQLVLLACGGEERITACPEPTFSMYNILSELTGTRYIDIPMEDDFELPADKILAVNPDIVFIAYPNNPTGNCFLRDRIEKVIEHCRGLVVIDEAYYEFSGKTFINDIDKYDNLVVLRTFSKAFSLAGIRAGYIAGNSVLISQFRKVQLPYNLSVFNQKILEVVVSERERILESAKIIVSLKNSMYENLKNIDGVEPYPSDSNFILMKLNNIEEVLLNLKENKIKVREFSSKDLKDYLRVTVGTDGENERFLKVLKESA